MDTKSRKERGLTLLEMMISLAVLSIMITSMFSIAVQSYAFIGDNEADFGAQNEATQAFERMTEILRKCGWNTSADHVTYPRVLNQGKELQFRVLSDLDGNGYAFKEGTGELEWSSTIYRIVMDGKGSLRVFAGDDPIWHLCRHIRNVNFETYLQNNSLQMREISVSVETERMTRRSRPVSFTLSGTIDMRN